MARRIAGVWALSAAVLALSAAGASAATWTWYSGGQGFNGGSFVNLRVVNLTAAQVSYSARLIDAAGQVVASASDNPTPKTISNELLNVGPADMLGQVEVTAPTPRLSVTFSYSTAVGDKHTVFPGDFLLIGPGGSIEELGATAAAQATVAATQATAAANRTTPKALKRAVRTAVKTIAVQVRKILRAVT